MKKSELNYNSNILFEYRDKKIIDKDFITKKRNRKDKKKLLKNKHIISIFHRMIDWLLEHEKIYFQINNTYYFYSRQYDIGLIVNIKKDKKKKQIFIKTWLKDIANIAKKDRSKSIKIHPETYYILNQKCVNYLFSINTGKFVKTDDNSISKLKILDCFDNEIELDVFFQQGKVWHITNIDLCEIY